MERIDHIAFGLTHFLSFRIADQGMDINVSEGDFAHEFQAHHNHPGYPEE